MDLLILFLTLIAGGLLTALAMGAGFLLGYRARAGYEPKIQVPSPFSIAGPRVEQSQEVHNDWEEEWERSMRGLAKEAGLLEEAGEVQ